MRRLIESKLYRAFINLSDREPDSTNPPQRIIVRTLGGILHLYAGWLPPGDQHIEYIAIGTIEHVGGFTSSMEPWCVVPGGSPAAPTLNVYSYRKHLDGVADHFVIMEWELQEWRDDGGWSTVESSESSEGKAA